MPGTPHPSDSYTPDWSDAPSGWNWTAQDEDGRWYWYKTEPVLGIGGGIWRSNSRSQRLAGQGTPNPLWYESMHTRPNNGQAAESDLARPDSA
ncbi:hypothetical protein KVP09_11185 [Alcaligenaceae bacterium CGII-47]|nr:hypothetical protein [Alcaligenaceae bacterium CGII-47]